jgi:septum site-determining protein MinD
MVKRGEMLSTDDVVELLAIDLLGIVPEDENVVISTNRGNPISMDGKNRAGQAFRNIARRMQGEQVPFLELEEQTGLFNRLSRRLFGQGGA